MTEKTTLLEIEYPAEYDDPYWLDIAVTFGTLDAWVQANQEDGHLTMEGGGSLSLIGDTFSWTENITIRSLKSGAVLTVLPSSLTLLDGEIAYVALSARPLATATVSLSHGNPANKERNALPVAVRIGTNLHASHLIGATFNEAIPEIVPMTSTGPISASDSGKLFVAVLTVGTPTLDMQLPPAALGLQYYLSARAAGAPPGSYAVVDFGASTFTGRYTQAGRWASWTRARLGGGGDYIRIVSMELTPGVFNWVLMSGSGQMANDLDPSEVWAFDIPSGDYIRYEDVDQSHIPWALRDLTGDTPPLMSMHGFLFTNESSTGNHTVTFDAQQHGTRICAAQTHASNTIRLAFPASDVLVLPNGETQIASGVAQIESAEPGAYAVLSYTRGSADLFWTIELCGRWKWIATSKEIATAFTPRPSIEVVNSTPYALIDANIDVLHVLYSLTAQCDITIATALIGVAGWSCTIKDTGRNARTHNITIVGAGGQNIEGDPLGTVINTNGGSLTLQSDGVGLWIM